jgi:hypothetical protein
MKKMKSTMLIAVCAAALAACGGGSDSAPTVTLVAASDTSVNVNPTVAAALVNTSFSFPSGAPALGTTAATTIQFTNTATAPAFSITSGGNTASGTTTFGSCIFRVSNSSFPLGHPLANGQTVTVDPCSANINTTGAVANGVATSRNVALLLGTAASSGVTVLVGVNTSGQLILSGAVIANIALTPATGT